MAAQLKVRVLAYPQLNFETMAEMGYVPHEIRLGDEEPVKPASGAPQEEWDAYDAAVEAYDLRAMPTASDELAEIAGRECYQSHHRPNPKTVENADYIGINLIGKEHWSVLAHAHIVLWVSGVSRALLLELERHQKKSHLNLSVLSQRYVNHGEGSPVGVVVPPLFDDELARDLEEEFIGAQEWYDKAYNRLRDQGHDYKAARGAARAFLPENTETRFVVTASIRGWRDVLEQRLPETADIEIRQFAMEVLRLLHDYAPHSVQDYAAKYLTEEASA